MAKHAHKQFHGSRNPVARDLHKVNRAKVIPDKRGSQPEPAWWELLDDDSDHRPAGVAHVLPAGAVAGHCPMCHPYMDQQSGLHLPVYCEPHSI